MSFDIAKRKGLPTIADVKAGRVPLQDVQALLPSEAAKEALRRWLERHEAEGPRRWWQYYVGRDIHIPRGQKR